VAKMNDAYSRGKNAYSVCIIILLYRDVERSQGTSGRVS
jgi:hypothetical protein